MPLEPRARFVAIYELANERYETEVSGIDSQHEWHLIENARVRFAATILGFARSLGISEIADTAFPPIRGGDSAAFESFELELAHVVAQFMTDNSLRILNESLELRGTVRERLQALAAKMRENVEHLDLPPDRREALHRRIEAFEKALRQARLPLVAVAQLALAVALGTSGIAQGAVAFLELHDRIVHAVAEEKDVQDRERSELLVRLVDQRVVPAARQLEYQRQAPAPKRSSGPRENFSADLDDEIPF